jgi:hypothetical protein
MEDIEINKIPKNWDAEKQEYKESVIAGGDSHSFFFKFFLGSLVLLLLAGLYAGVQYYLNQNSVSAEKIVLNLNIPEYVDSGIEMQEFISIENKNKTTLENTNLRISYQQGTRENGEADMENKTLSMGNLIKNTMYSTSTPFVFLGEENAKFIINLALDYKVAGSNAVFTKTLQKEVKISRAQVTLKITGRENVIADHETTLNIKIRNVAQENFLPTNINVVIPSNFIYKKEDGAQSGRNPVFKVSNLKIGEEKEFSLTGYFKDGVGLTKTFRVYASEDNGQDSGSAFANDQTDMLISPHPVRTTFVTKINGGQVNRLILGREASFGYTIKNITGGSLDNINVKISFSNGQAFSFTDSDSPDLLRLTPDGEVKLEFMLQNVADRKLKIKLETFGKFKGEPNTILFKAETFDLVAE